MSAIEFHPLTEEMLLSAQRLSAQAGWEQTSEDWRRLISLDPSSVQVWCDEGEVRASYSIASYGRELAWIGMVLVDRDYRGRGLGKIVFQQALDDARARGIQALGLDATDLGEPIYQKVGFAYTCPIVRWRGVLSDLPESKDVKVILCPPDELLELDRLHTKTDRSHLLKNLCTSSAHIFQCERDGACRGYAILKPSRTAWHLGPVVAETQADFIALLGAVARQVEGETLICDVLNPEADEILTRSGLSPIRNLKRMTLPLVEGCLTGPAIWCGAGFEWG